MAHIILEGGQNCQFKAQKAGKSKGQKNNVR